MNEHCQVLLSPEGLQALRKVGSSTRQLQTITRQMGHVRSLRSRSQGLPWFSSVTIWSLGALRKWFAQPCARELTYPLPRPISGQLWHGSCSILQRGKLRGHSPNDSEGNDLDISGPGQKHRSSNSNLMFLLPNHAEH